MIMLLQKSVMMLLIQERLRNPHRIFDGADAAG